MHKNFICTLITSIFLSSLLATAKPRNLVIPRTLPSTQQQGTQCSDPTSPKSFSFRGIAYLRYTTAQYQHSPQPNSTQLAFELVNENTGISTGCACQIVMNSAGDWADDGDILYACVDRTIAVDGVQYPVKTSARVAWDDWRITVNQTWACEESITTSQFSALTLTPTCTETISASQYIKECTAPDVVVAATSDGNIIS